jgi:membrane protein required for colicin V production
MPITILDGIVLGVALFSAILAMVRGFSREVLSVASWVGAAAAAYFLYPHLLPYASQYTTSGTVAMIGSAAVIFLIALIIISFITMRVADFIIDSRIGALDRTLGFLFGAARGILLLVVAVAFWNWLVDADHRPAWVNNAKSKPFLDSLVVRLQAVLPDEFAQMIQKSITEKLGGARTTEENAPANDQAPAEDAAPAPNNGAQQPSN